MDRGKNSKPRERRKNRKKFSEEDQEFLNLVRDQFGKQLGKTQYLSQEKLQRFLKIRDRRLVKNLFRNLDADGDGKVNEKDFLQTVTEVILGSDQRKIEFIFSLHDSNGDGSISREELDTLFKAGLNHSSFRLSPSKRKEVLDALFRKAGVKKLNLSSFKELLNQDREIKNRMLEGVSAWFGYRREKRKKKEKKNISSILRFIFVVIPFKAWRVLLLLAYLGANGWFFTQAFLHYREAGATIYIQIARGSGACLNFNGMLILIPMMRTLVTWIRKTFLAVFIPVDENIEIHKMVGKVMFLFALVHSAAHIMNYISSGMDLKNNLLFTRVGLTGTITMGAFLLIWFFSLSFIRKSSFYEWFSSTHLLYWVWFPAAMIHVRTFFLWTIIPVSGFFLELLIRKFIKSYSTFVDQGIIHESPVTQLKLQRPDNFHFQAGEYLFIKIPSVSHFGWHPFTISSAPEQEDTVDLHIRALGNWTKRLYSRMKELPKKKRRFPVKIHGPYGTPSIRIFRSKVAVLVGAGIGVTPFASILESIVLKKEQGIPMNLEKVYFYWIYRGQETFQWIGELLARIDGANHRMLNIQVYMTDASIDPLNGLIKIGMNLSQKGENQDALTGLKNRTNFGRPDWGSIFEGISKKHSLKRVDVFYCGPYLLGDLIRKSAHHQGFHFRMENF